jgi:hypothetical protein
MAQDSVVAKSPNELRDTERAIILWQDKAAEFGGVPPDTTLELCESVEDDGSYRFVICTDEANDDRTFLSYGPKFAELFQLSIRVQTDVPINRALPDHSVAVFEEGCRQAIAQLKPVRMSGALLHHDVVELYRAAFMPLAARYGRFMRVFGSFNQKTITLPSDPAERSRQLDQILARDSPKPS